LKLCVREKHNRVLLAMRILTLFFWAERGRAIVNRSHTELWKSLSKWSCNFSNNEKKCRPKSNGSANKPNENMLTWRLCFNSLRSPLSRNMSYRQRPHEPLQLLRPLILLWSCGRIIGRGFSPSRELMLFQMTVRLWFFSTPETPPREINDLTMDQIVAYMKVQFDPMRFVIRERFKYWMDYHATSTWGVHSRAGCTHTSSSGYVRFCFHCRFLRPVVLKLCYAYH